MESFIIEGGHPLQGTINPQGAKNEALEVICTTILTDDPVRINNVPDILDVNNLIKLLKEIGVKVTKHNRHDYTFQSDELNLDYLDSLEFVKKCSSLRGSVLMWSAARQMRQGYYSQAWWRQDRSSSSRYPFPGI